MHNHTLSLSHTQCISIHSHVQHVLRRDIIVVYDIIIYLYYIILCPLNQLPLFISLTLAAVIVVHNIILLNEYSKQDVID